MMTSSGNAQAFYRRKPFPRVDAIIPRIGASITFYGTAVVRQLETMGVYVLNSANAIVASRDKLRCLQELSQHDVGLPPTGFARQPELAKSLLALVDGPPAIVKLLEGAQGAGVIRVDSRAGFDSTVDAFHSVSQNILVQKYVSQTAGSDLRLVVVGGKVVAGMRRQAAKGEFRSNVHRGGTVSAVRPDAATREVAVRAAGVLGLEFAGVDLLESADGPLVVEVNSSPGLEGIEAATGLDIAALLVEHLERRATPREARPAGAEPATRTTTGHNPTTRGG